MSLINFIKNNSVEMSEYPAGTELIKKSEEITHISFGKELKEYIGNYGYLAYEYIEFYGINSKQGLKSDMVTQTLYLHKYFEPTRSFIALGNDGDGFYILIDSKDQIYEFDSENNSLSPVGMNLLNYIANRFANI